MSFTFNWVSTPGQNNNFVNGSINSGRARAFLDDGNVDPFDSPLYICIPPITFAGGNGSAATLLDFARLLGTCALPRSTVANPARNYNGNIIPTGGALTINGNPCGNYEFNILPGGTTLTQATVATLFSSTEDISTWIVVQGNLTIPTATVLIPTVNPTYTLPSGGTTLPDPNAKRRLFMVVYAKGNLTLADSSSAISMTACGGNSSSTGANIASFNIPIASNVYYFSTGGITPTIQSVGSAGGAAVSSSNGNPGSNVPISPDGSQLYTAGGGSGNQAPAGANLSGAGGSGSPFSGGAGGGSATKNNGATAGSSLGGAGGNGTIGGVGGTGNPGGTGGAASGNSGTGGVVIVICEGSMTSTGGTVRANGVDSLQNSGQEGGASGGGIAVLIESSSTATFPASTATGGQRQSAGGAGASGSTYNYGINS